MAKTGNSRGIHCVYVNNDKFARVKKMGVSISLLIEAALDKFGKDETFEYTLQMDYLESQIKEMEIKLEVVGRERNIIVRKLRNAKNEYARLFERMQLEESAITMSQLLASLNRVIRACDFEVACIKKSGKDILSQIYKIDTGFDLLDHIRVVEDLQK